MDYYYNYGLVALSFLLAVIASFSALGLASRIPHIAHSKVLPWLLGGAVAMGLGIWSMHFVGMLAFHLPIPLAYDLNITLTSVFIAIVASGVALFIMRNGIRSRQGLYASAVLMGLGIAGMHYTGMAAMKMSPPIDYDAPVVLLSILIAIFASLFALRTAFALSRSAPLLFSRHNLGAALLMGVAIAGMHYTGMAAANFDPQAVCLASPKGIDTNALAVVISITTLLILAGTILLLSFDIRLAERKALMVRQLQRHNEELKQRAEELALSMTEQLRDSYARDRMLATIVEQSQEALITTDMTNRITNWNQAASNIFGYTADEALGESISLINPYDGDEQCEVGLAEKINNDNHSFIRRRNKQGKTVYVNIQTTPLADEFGNRTGTIHMMRDVTQRHHNHQQLVLWSSVFTNSGEGIIITDSDNRIISVNNTFTAITGYKEEEVKGENPSILSSGRQDAPFYREMWQTLQRDGIWKGEVWNRRKHGEFYPEWLTITTLRDQSGHICNYIGIFSDASLYKEKEERISYLAYHDKLTGLPNRSLLEDRLTQSIAHADRIGKRVAILFIDLDRFKMVNDTLGHHVGDILLQEAAQRLSHAVRSDDTVCRQGGDEFIVIVQEIGLVDDAAHIAQKLLSDLSSNYEIEGEQLSITPSIGISIYPDDGDEIDTLIKHADTAMYHAKEQGRGNYQFFTQQLNERIQEHMQLEKALANAIERGELSLRFQPQIRLSDATVTGTEVLLRWHHPELGEVQPERFIPVAEESGQIDAIGAWVLQQTAGQIGRWLDAGAPVDTLCFSINISARQLDGTRLIDTVDQLFRSHPFLAGRLEFEITETAVMHDIERSIEQLKALKCYGLSIAVDDFGTGYSSLGYLKRLPIDRVKIDRTFITDLPDDRDDASITEAILRLAQTLELQVIAEGIETAAQHEFLVHHGCELGQGFHFHHPLPAEEFILTLK